VTQPTVELARRFAFESFALAESLGPALKFVGSQRRLFKMADEHP
jgi:hypothetical protein